MTFTKLVGVVAILLVVDATVEGPIWKTGEHGQTCTDVCNGIRRHCIGGYWPTDVRSMLNISASAGEGVSRCVDVIQTTKEYAPSINADNECFYKAKATGITCDSPVEKKERRFCPCHSSAPSFELSGISQSCTEFCRSRGGFCSSDAGLWPKTEDAMQAMVQPLGMSCNSIEPVKEEPFHAPSIKGDKCFYPKAASYVSCDEHKSNYRRFCPCMGTSDFTSASSASGSSKVANAYIQTSILDIVPLLVVEARTCQHGRFRDGIASGGMKMRVVKGLGALNSTECLGHVLQRCPDANGASYDENSGHCYCHFGMTGVTQMRGMAVCQFVQKKDVDTNAKFELLPTKSAAIKASTTSGAVCTVAMLLGVFGAFMACKRRSFGRLAAKADGIHMRMDD